MWFRQTWVQMPADHLLSHQLSGHCPSLWDYCSLEMTGPYLTQSHPGVASLDLGCLASTLLPGSFLPLLPNREAGVN